MCQKKNHKTIESLEQSLDRVNSWIGNCDQKTGFLLAIIGILIAIVFSSNFADTIRKEIVTPFLEYLKSPEDYTFSCTRVLYFVLLLVTFISCTLSLVYSLLALTAAIDIQAFKKKPGNNELVGNSLLFFGSISKLGKYSDFKNMAGVDYEEDLKSQIFVNSTICTNKFRRYNISLYSFLVMVLGFVALFITGLFL